MNEKEVGDIKPKLPSLNDALRNEHNAIIKSARQLAWAGAHDVVSRCVWDNTAIPQTILPGNADRIVLSKAIFASVGFDQEARTAYPGWY